MKKLITILSLILSLSVYGQWSNNPEQNMQITSMEGEQTSPKIVTLENGSSYVSWFSVEPSDLNPNWDHNYNVRLQFFNENGEKQWGDDGILISNNLSQTYITDYSLASDSEKNGIVAFQDYRGEKTTISVYKTSKTGEILWGENGIVLSEGLEGDHFTPKVTMTENNSAVIAWTYAAAEDGIQRVCVSKINSDGSFAWEDKVKVLKYESEDGEYYSLPEIVKADGENFILHFSLMSGMFWAPNRLLYARKYDADFNTVWANDALITDQLGMPGFAPVMVKSDEDGGMLIGWSDDRDNNLRADAYIQHIDKDGNLILTENGQMLSSNMNNNHYNPQVDYNSDANFYVAYWTEMDGNQAERGIYGQKVSAESENIWEAEGRAVIRLSLEDISAGPTTLLSDGSSVFLYSVFNHGDFVNSSIMASKVDSDGNFLWDGNIKPISNVASEKGGNSASYSKESNSWIAVWSDGRNGTTENGNKDIYMQNIDIDGNLGNNLINDIEDDNVVKDFTVLGNYPNPFNPETSISFINNKAANIEVSVFNIKGELVNKIVDREFGIGKHSINFNAEGLNSGVYYYQVKSAEFKNTGKMVLIK